MKEKVADFVEHGEPEVVVGPVAEAELNDCPVGFKVGSATRSAPRRCANEHNGDAASLADRDELREKLRWFLRSNQGANRRQSSAQLFSVPWRALYSPCATDALS